MSKVEKNNQASQDKTKQERVERLQELRKSELEHIKTLDYVDADEFEKENGPINYRLEDEKGIFTVEEGEDGYVDVKIESKDGDVIDLKKFLPGNHEIVGRQLVVYDTEKYGMGSYNIGSHYEHEYHEIVINEKEIQKQGWKYVWTLLHEIGHAIVDKEKPELAEVFRDIPRESMIFNEFIKEANIEGYLEFQEGVAENEAWACYAGLKLFKSMLEKHPFLKDVFKDEEEDINEFYKNLLLDKAKYLAGSMDDAAQDRKNIHVTEENKEELKRRLFEMYQYEPEE